jgi:NAD(P)-dependent dehydrogenase (short-subunit alcohol dehydrogenase family)
MDGRKVVMVTGAGSGIGQSISLAFLEKGYSVALVGRRQERLEALVEQSKLLPGSAIACAGDVSNPTDVEKIFAKAYGHFGRLDLLFNNAGVFTPNASVEDVCLEDWIRSINTNVTGAFLCTQAAVKLMKAQTPCGGRIINNGSIAAHSPRPHSAPYTVSKHAITGLTKSTSLDGRKYNIACGQIDIGNAATDMTSKMNGGVLQANGRIEPEPTMSVENVTRAVLYMADLPLDANVQFMTVMATNMPYIGRG